MIKDLAGNEVKEGPCVVLTGGSGSALKARCGYCLGTKGKASALLLGRSAYIQEREVDELVKAFKEGNKDLPTYSKLSKRIIMLYPEDK